MREEDKEYNEERLQQRKYFFFKYGNTLKQIDVIESIKVSKHF